MKITTVSELGTMIRDKRKKLHLTQAQLCEYSGISASFISDLENGKQTIELGKALFVLQLLGLDMELKDRGSGV